jgi:hypothetical protein
MKVRPTGLGLIILLLLCAVAVPARAQTTNQQQTLNQYVAELQSNPNDTALREKIIALALTMNPPPEVPAESRRHLSRGVAAVEDAKTPDDFKDACNEFQQAATLAPWLANAYRNLAIAQDKAGLYDESLASLRLYMLTKPSSADMDWADDLKAKVEYRREKAAKAKEEESSPQAVAAREQQSFQDLLRKVDGRRYTSTNSNLESDIDIKGRFLVIGLTVIPGPGLSQSYTEQSRIEIQGRVTTHSFLTTGPNGGANVEDTYTISEDGGSITQHRHYYANGDHQRDYIYLRQR